MNYQQAIKYIQEDDGKIVLDLSKIEKLLSLLGNPEKNLKYVHVAGTNGKGSVCAMTATVLTKAGYRTGLFTSPVIMNFSEQFKIDGEEISEKDFIECALIIKEKVELMEEKPSSFEKALALAFVYFLQKECDIVVLEVGMGGEGDATNVIPWPEVACIVNIDYDHMGFLGNSIREITQKKAGIIKKGCTVVLADQSKEATEVVEEVSEAKQVELVKSDNNVIQIKKKSARGQVISYKNYSDIELPLLGEHQSANLAIVIEIIEVLKKRGFSIRESALRDGLKSVKWPGRFEIISDKPLFIVDGAHNPHGIAALRGSLAEYFMGCKFIFIVGILGDKDYKHMIESMLPLAAGFVTISPNNPRALSSEACADEVRKAGFRGIVITANQIQDGVKQALNMLNNTIEAEGICAFGSLYSISMIKEGLKSCE